MTLEEKEKRTIRPQSKHAFYTILVDIFIRQIPFKMTTVMPSS